MRAFYLLNKVFLIIFAGMLLVSCSGKENLSPEGIEGLSTSTPPVPPSYIEERLGIKVVGVRYTAAGYMLDFRYRVTDPKLSLPIFDRKEKPYLIHEKSGARFMVPNPAKIGPLRADSTVPQMGRMYYIFFANPGRYVKQGDMVTVVVGDIKLEHLVIQ